MCVDLWARRASVCCCWWDEVVGLRNFGGAGTDCIVEVGFGVGICGVRWLKCVFVVELLVDWL